MKSKNNYNVIMNYSQNTKKLGILHFFINDLYIRAKNAQTMALKQNWKDRITLFWKSTTKNCNNNIFINHKLANKLSRKRYYCIMQ